MLAFFISSSGMWSQEITKEALLGKINPAKDSTFSKIPSAHTSKENIYLKTEALNAFIKMSAAAKKEGINLTIISATRTFDQQKAIWERKWKRAEYQGWTDEQKALDIMKFSSMPGTSRHHWGTDIDMNSLENKYFESGAGLKMYQWLCAHAAEYGFYQTYTSKEKGRTGYNEEKWHWSYVPISGPYLESYKKKISYNDINGFSGSSAAALVKAIDNYVLGIEIKK
ncbi:MAG: M15 family metallopeptidase [Flavobacteriales bacterium]